MVLPFKNYTPGIDQLLLPLENSIRTTLLPKLIGREAPNDLERSLFALPARLGGLNIENPASLAEDQYKASQQVTKPLIDLIASQNKNYPYEVLLHQINTKNKIKERRRRTGLEVANSPEKKPLPAS